jgi:hypothetical protein
MPAEKKKKERKDGRMRILPACFKCVFFILGVAILIGILWGTFLFR